ncbi:MAG: MarC family protein [Candidatus Omnitrophota bacterium]|jgi:multiple antibiotic resistance protein|nr:MAG: MarC family protein [Candidatus Omnitrophota bacterium]
MFNITLRDFISVFIPIFVAVDVVGTIPLFIALVDGQAKKQRRKIVIDSVTTASLIAVLFLFIGKGLLGVIGITIPDFQIAGGALIFIISVRLLLPGAKKSLNFDKNDKFLGIFPLGTPLITGPAVLTTALMMIDIYGVKLTLLSIILNMLIVWYVLARAEDILHVMGQTGVRAVSKIMYILLAAIGVMMIRRGIMGVFL